MEEKISTIFSFGYKKSNTGKITFFWNSQKFQRKDFEIYEFKNLFTRKLDRLLYGFSNSAMLKGINTHKVNSHLIIREMVYEMLKLDLESYCSKNNIDIIT